MTELEGVIPVVPMPFDEDGEIDVGGLRRATEFLVTRPIRGIAFGFASEVSRLTDAERDLALRTVAEVVSGSLPVIATLQAHSTLALSKRGEAARGNGAAIIMATPPASGPYAPDDLVAHFAAVGWRVGLPLIIQDAPAISGVETPVDVLARLAVEVPEVIAIKTEAPPTAPRVSALVEAIGSSAAVMGGAGGLDFLNELDRGAAGCLPGAAFPELFARVFELHRAGERDAARALFDNMLPILCLQSRDHETFCRVQKAILQRRGILQHASTRSPVPRLDDVLDRELATALDGAARMWPELGLGTSTGS